MEKEKYSLKNVRNNLQADARKSNVLQLSDFHMDLSYQIGTDVDCGMPMCCMNTTKMATDPAKAAGDWGAYKCDLTRWTADDMLKHIAEAHSDEVSPFFYKTALQMTQNFYRILNTSC